MNSLGFDFKHFKGDFLGGITAGIVALPLALAFGVSSGLGASAGLYGAIFISFFAALFGGTNTQISGPTAPMTAFSMGIIATIIAKEGGIDAALPIILTIFLLAGFVQIILGLVGIGKYIKYIPYPVVSGFMTAIGVMIIITQLLPMLGYKAQEDKAYVEQFKPKAEEVILSKILEQEAGEDILVLEDYEETIKRGSAISTGEIMTESQNLAKKSASGVIGSLRVLPRAIKNVKLLEVLLALVTIFIIFGFKRITTAIPSTLVALFIVSGAAIIGGLDYVKIEEIPGKIPLPELGIFTEFSFAKVKPYIFASITLALLGAIDSLLTSIVADNMTKTRHKPNKELIGQGIGNSIAALFGGIPGAGATIRTVVNINAGGKTKLSGMIAGLLLVTILLVLGPIASKIPLAVLAGILITVGIGVMDYKGLKAIPHMPKPEVAILLVVLFLSTFWDLVYAVGIGLVIASLMFMKKIGDQTAKKSKVGALKEEEAWSDEGAFPKNLKEEVFIKHINGPLFFGSTSDLQQMAAQIPSTASAVIIRMDKMTYMDQSGLYTLEDIMVDLVKQGKEVLLVGLVEQPKYMMERIDIIPDLIPENKIFNTFDECLKYVVANVEDVFPPTDAA